MIMNIRASRTIAAHSFIALPLPRTGNTDFSPVLIVRAIMAVAKGFCRGLNATAVIKLHLKPQATCKESR
jgi:hypothetical protein